MSPIGDAPAMLPFETVSTDTSLPNAFVGQIRGDAGSGTGFVVRPRVVATVGHVVFNDGTLAATTGLQWLFQNDRNVHEPVPVIPRGSYLLTGYAAQRALDNSPGVSSPESQNLDAATMFFLQDVGRGGFSGYLASDTSINEFLVSDSLKTLAGYPVDGIPGDRPRPHARHAADERVVQQGIRTHLYHTGHPRHRRCIGRSAVRAGWQRRLLSGRDLSGRHRPNRRARDRQRCDRR